MKSFALHSQEIQLQLFLIFILEVVWAMELLLNYDFVLSGWRCIFCIFIGLWESIFLCPLHHCKPNLRYISIPPKSYLEEKKQNKKKKKIKERDRKIFCGIFSFVCFIFPKPLTGRHKIAKSSAAIVLCHFVLTKGQFIIGQDTPLYLHDFVSLLRGSNSYHAETGFYIP